MGFSLSNPTHCGQNCRMKKFVALGILLGAGLVLPFGAWAQDQPDEETPASHWHIFSDLYYETGWLTRVTLPGETSLNAPGETGFGIEFFSGNKQDYHVELGFQYRDVDLKGFNTPALVDEGLFEARLGLRYYPLESTFGIARWTASVCANFSIGSGVSVGPIFTTGLSFGDEHYRSIDLLAELVLRPVSLQETLQNVTNGSGTPASPLGLDSSISFRIGLLLG